MIDHPSQCDFCDREIPDRSRTCLFVDRVERNDKLPENPVAEIETLRARVEAAERERDEMRARVIKLLAEIVMLREQRANLGEMNAAAEARAAELERERDEARAAAKSNADSYKSAVKNAVGWRQDFVAAEARAAVLERRLEQAVKALEPFVRHAAYVDTYFADDWDGVIAAGLRENPITLGDFRAAARALTSIQKDEDAHGQ